MVSRSSRPQRAFRIADSRWPIFDGTGAKVRGGRWNTPGRAVIYAAETYSGALLEILVHTLGRKPGYLACVEIEIPADLDFEELTPSELPDWDSPAMEASRVAGDGWLERAHSAVLLVPSVVSRRERNVLINPAYADFARIRASDPVPVRWDARLWER